MQELVHGYLDGELDLTGSLEVERHMEGCLSCSRIYSGQKTLQPAYKDSSLYYSASPQLRKRIKSSLKEATRAEAPTRVMPWKWLAIVASLTCTLLITFIGWNALQGRRSPSGDELIAQEVVSDHVRSLIGTHLFDIESSDQHTVKPWFDGRVDFAPPVGNFSDQGYPLV